MIKTKCRELNQLIKDSTEYKKYITAKNMIKSNEQLYNSLMSFKQRYTDVM
ncbi:MAG TPA: hypothetical protein DEO83_06820, partial [Lachnospiraceae bacterium]|nr:hypothetical protein [Lachnospiraceae bacterium]